MWAALEKPMVGDLIAGVIGKVIDRAWPDPTQKAQIAIELEKLRQSGEFRAIDAELERSKQQTDVNKTEAAHASIWVAGWRPAIGWVGAASLGWHFIGRPMAIGVTGEQIPEVDLGDLITIVAGMLGLGFARTTEKIKGVAK
jgi:hypothetical protein